MTTENYIRLEDEYGARNYKPLDVVLTRGKGVWGWDVEGEKYLDCRSLGVCLPKGLSFLDGKVRPIAADGFIGTRQEFRVGHSE